MVKNTQDNFINLKNDAAEALKKLHNTNSAFLGRPGNSADIPLGYSECVLNVKDSTDIIRLIGVGAHAHGTTTIDFSDQKNLINKLADIFTDCDSVKHVGESDSSSYDSFITGIHFASRAKMLDLPLQEIRLSEALMASTTITFADCLDIVGFAMALNKPNLLSPNGFIERWASATAKRECFEVEKELGNNNFSFVRWYTPLWSLDKHSMPRKEGYLFTIAETSCDKARRASISHNIAEAAVSFCAATVPKTKAPNRHLGSDNDFGDAFIHHLSRISYKNSKTNDLQFQLKEDGEKLSKNEAKYANIKAYNIILSFLDYCISITDKSEEDGQNNMKSEKNILINSKTIISNFVYDFCWIGTAATKAGRAKELWDDVRP